MSVTPCLRPFFGIRCDTRVDAAQYAALVLPGLRDGPALLAVGPMLLPAAAARCWELRAAASMALATAFGLTASIAGLLVSYHGNLPSGPAIVLAGGLLFGISLVATKILRRLAPRIRRGA